MTHDIIKFMYERDHEHANVYFDDIYTLSRNDPTKCGQK